MTFTFTDAAQIEEAPDFWTSEAIDQYLSEEEPDCDDSDDGYALASAGWGTNEDYGCAADW
jgi:hypothetical protein